MLTITPERLAYIIEKARQFDAETAPVDSDPGSNPSDDRGVDVLEASAENASGQELAAALDALNDDERIELLALMWVGRGDFGSKEWRAALMQAREIHNAAETDYLIGTPLLADYLEQGLETLGYPVEDYELPI